MTGIFSQFPFTMIDWAWLLEILTLTAAWIIVGYGGYAGRKNGIRIGIHFVLLFAVLNAVALLSMYITNVMGIGQLFPLIRVIVQGGITLLSMLVFSTGRRQTKIVLWLVMTTASLSVFSIAGKCSYLAGRWIGSGFPEGAVRVIIYMLLVLSACQLRHYRFDDYRALPPSGFLLVGIDMGCVLLMNAVEISGLQDDSTAFIVVMLTAYCITLIMGFAAIQALYTMCRGEKKVLDLQAEKQRIISEQEQTRMTEAMLHNLRSIRHDLKNQYAYMQILLKEKKYAQLETYFAELLKALPAPLQVVDCGNHTVNTVLNMELAKLQADHIPCTHQLAVPPVLPFRDEDICSILSNLIDNAADECRRLKNNGAAESKIHLDIHPHGSYLFIQCANSTDRTALERNKSGLRTTKKEAELHGYGTQIIARLAEKYNGICDYHLQEEKFVAQVMLDMASEGEYEN